MLIEERAQSTAPSSREFHTPRGRETVVWTSACRCASVGSRAHLGTALHAGRLWSVGHLYGGGTGAGDVKHASAPSRNLRGAKRTPCRAPSLCMFLGVSYCVTCRRRGRDCGIPLDEGPCRLRVGAGLDASAPNYYAVGRSRARDCGARQPKGTLRCHGPYPGVARRRHGHQLGLLRYPRLGGARPFHQLFPRPGSLSSQLCCAVPTDSKGGSASPPADDSYKYTLPPICVLHTPFGNHRLGQPTNPDLCSGHARRGTSTWRFRSCSSVDRRANDAIWFVDCSSVSAARVGAISS